MKVKNPRRITKHIEFEENSEKKAVRKENDSGKEEAKKKLKELGVF